LPNKNRAIYIVLHVSTIQIGDLVGKASAPVKIYAEKIFIEMETNEGKVKLLNLVVDMHVNNVLDKYHSDRRYMCMENSEV